MQLLLKYVYGGGWRQNLPAESVKLEWKSIYVLKQTIKSSLQLLNQNERERAK